MSQSSSPAPALFLPEKGREPFLEKFSAQDDGVDPLSSSSSQRRVLATLVTLCSLALVFANGTLMPTIVQIAKDLATTPEAISHASWFALATTLGALIGSSFSTLYGRRAVYLVALPMIMIGSVGVAMSMNINQFLVYRWIQIFGASPMIPLGASVIGDLYLIQERGQAMGIYFAITSLGTLLAAPFRGVVNHYNESWRVMQCSLGVFTLVLCSLVFMLFPGTAQCSGMSIREKMSISTENLKHIPQWKSILLSPARTLGLLRSPNVLLVALSGTFVVLVDNVLLVSLLFKLGGEQGISYNTFFIVCFIRAIIGAPFSGRISDKFIIKWRSHRGGMWYPEDRLRILLVPCLAIIPISSLAFGFLMDSEYIPHMARNAFILLCFFINGIVADMAISTSYLYCVDVLQSRSAEAIAITNIFRTTVFSLLVTPFFMPMINTYGHTTTSAVTATIAVTGGGIIWVVIKYGAQMRAFVDVGFSKTENH